MRTPRGRRPADPFAWSGPTDELVHRLRAPRYQIEIAIIAAAVVLSAGAVIAVPTPYPADHYQFFVTSDRVVVLNRQTGEVGLCTVADDRLVCTAEDSPADATDRAGRARWEED